VIPIIEFLEDLCDGVQCLSPSNPSSNREIQLGHREAFENAKEPMRGRTAEEKARTREILALADEATTYFSFACHKGSAMFGLLEAQSPITSSFAMESCKKIMILIEGHYSHGRQFTNIGDREIQWSATTADCVLFSLLQFAEIMYGIELVSGPPHLEKFKVLFEERESVRVEGMVWDESLRKIASHWIAEQQSLLGRGTEICKVAYLYLAVFYQLLMKVAWKR
jgi:hypothetical protein